MTKEELKKLVADKISGQGTQVDLGNALPTILNELIDGMGGGDEPIVIDLTNVEIDDEPVNVTAYVPQNYRPKMTDMLKTRIEDEELLISCVAIIMLDTLVNPLIEVQFGNIRIFWNDEIGGYSAERM